MPLRRPSPRQTAVACAAIGTLLVPIGSAAADRAAATGVADAPAGPPGYALAQQYNPAPTTRTLTPVSVYSTSGAVANPTGELSGAETTLSGTGSYVVLDFGKEVGGTLSVHISSTSDTSQHLGIAFVESSDYLTFTALPTSDTSTGGAAKDGALDVPVTAGTTYPTPLALQRGGFRYVVLFTRTPGSIGVDAVSVHLTASPLMGDNLQDYSNYFYSSDPLLNRIWYAGAYTVQLDTIAPDQGRAWPAPTSLWSNTGVVGPGRSVLVDGAKRDRTVWAGDLPVELATADVTTGDTESARNGLTALFDQQQSTGMFLYSGPPLRLQHSDTYHLWTLVGADEYVQLTGDRAWLAQHWDQYRKGIDFALSKVDANGLFYLTETYDSASILTKGEYLAANVLLWSALSEGARLADLMGDTATAATYRVRADQLRTQIYASFWDAAAGAFRAYPTSTVIPQDGNVFAVWLGLVTDPAQLSSISAARQRSQGPLGTQRPEHKNQLDIFDSSIEVHQEFLTGTPQADGAAIDLVKRTWGYQLEAPDGTNSTFWESMRDNGCICSNYVSMAHGWATGPTSALTNYVLGLKSTGVGGSSWRFQPHLSGLSFAQGRLATPAGTLGASWHVDNQGRLRAQLSVPRGTPGTIAVPVTDTGSTVRFSGHIVWSDGAADAAGVSRDGGYVVVPVATLPGAGERNLTVTVD